MSNNIKVAIIEPPFNNYTFLGSNLLFNFLIKNKIKVDQINLNKEILYYFLNLKFLIKKRKYLEKNQEKDNQDQIYYLNYILKNKKFLKERIKKDYKLFNAIFYYLLQDLDVHINCDINNKKLRELINNPTKEIIEIKKILTKIILRKKINKKYEFIGITIPHGNLFIYSLIFAEIIKGLNKKTHICIGGSVVTLLDDSILKYWKNKGVIDSYVKYDGEIKLLRLLKKIKTKKKANTNNLSKIDINSQRIYKINDMTNSEIRILQSKGCYYNQCAYCDYVNLYNCKSTIIKDPKILFDEIKNIKSRYGICNFYLVNECIQPDQAENISDLILKNNLKIRWTSYMRVDNRFTEEILKKMRDSGFEGCLGLESTNDRVLKLIKKGYTKKMITKFLDKCLKINLIFKQVNIILNLPTTTFKEARAVFNFLEKYKKIIKFINYMDFKLTSTSQIGNNPQKYGIKILDNSRKSTFSRGYLNQIEYIDNKGMSKEELNKVKNLYYNLNKKQIEYFCYNGILRKIRTFDFKKMDIKYKLLKKRFILVSNSLFNFIDIYNRQKFLVDDFFIRILKVIPNNHDYTLSKLIKRFSKDENKEVISIIKEMIKNQFFEEVGIIRKNKNL